MPLPLEYAGGAGVGRGTVAQMRGVPGQVWPLTPSSGQMPHCTRSQHRHSNSAGKRISKFLSK